MEEYCFPVFFSELEFIFEKKKETNIYIYIYYIICFEAIYPDIPDSWVPSVGAAYIGIEQKIPFYFRLAFIFLIIFTKNKCSMHSQTILT